MSNILIFLGILSLILSVIDNSAADPDLGIDVIHSDDDDGLNSRKGQLMARAKTNDTFLKRRRRYTYGNSNSLFLDPGKIDPAIGCSTKSGEEGTCVLYYQCNPESPANFEYNSNSKSSKKCPHYLYVCCRNEDLVNLESIPQCGWSNPGGGGGARFGPRSGDTSQHAEFAEFPWIVAILRNTGSSGDWDDSALLGGGTLIHPSVVLTAAHKLTIPGSGGERYYPKELKCRAGEHDTQTTQELYNHQDRAVDRYIVHEQFDPVSMINDIMLLLMKVPFDLDQGDHISAGCLSSIAPTPSANCYGAGWGTEYDNVYENRKVLSSVMKKVQLHFLEQDPCNKRLLLMSKSKSSFRPHGSLVCMNGNQRLDSCEADSGSPVVCPISTKPGETRYAVYGIAVSRTECNKRPSLQLAANVPNLRSWVDSKMIDEGFEIQYYTI